MAHGLMAALLDLLFPPHCIFCQKLLHTGEQALCASCQRSLPWLTEETAEQCGAAFSRCVSPLHYQGAVRTSLLRYKFKGRRYYAGLYGRLTAQCVRDHGLAYDLITWVPLSAVRLRQRGYDQAMLLAQAAAQALDGTAVPTLRKYRHTDAQSGLSDAAARAANVRDAYEALSPAQLCGKRILLLDDIVTTGATLEACARALRAAGAAEVLCATLARSH